MRFPEFTEEWNYAELHELAPSISSGRDKPTNGSIALYGSTGQMGMTDKASYTNEIVLVARVGANAGTMQIVNEPCGVTDNALVVNAGLWNKYIFYYLQKCNLNRLIFGSGQPLITGGMLKKIKIRFGSEVERAKIIKFLILIDERISTQIKIIEDLKQLRLALIELLYSQSQPNYKIGDMIVQVSNRNRNEKKYPVLSVNNQLGFIEQSEQFEDRMVASDDTSNYKVVNYNDFAYNPARINVGSIARLTSFENGIVSPMYVCFHTKRQLLPEYLECFFDTQYFYNEIQKRLEGSVRLCLSWEGICNIPITIPTIERQKDVSKQISILFDKISIEERYLKMLGSQKKYILSQMFI